MKKILFAVTLMLIPAFAALAQYVPSQIEQSKGRLLDDNGEVMPDFMVRRLVGDEIFEETYLGAVKQYKAGKRLMVGGGIVVGAGLAVSGVSLGVFFANYVNIWKGENIWDSFSQAKDVLSWFYRGFSIAGLGASVFTMGVIFKTVGWKRLEWVAEEYNNGRPAVTLRFGAGEYGTGLVLNF